MQDPETATEPRAKGQNVALYPDDVARVERIRRHYDLDSFSQAVRRAVRVTAAAMPDEAEPESLSDLIDETGGDLEGAFDALLERTA